MVAMDDFYPLILAAGKGVRMRSDIPKALHPLLGKPMLCYVIEAVRALHPSKIYLVVSDQSSLRKEELGNYPLEFIIQTEPLGTGHAVLQARHLLQGREGVLMVMNGDSPLITPQTLRGLLRSHRKSGAIATTLTAMLDDPTGYGRIIRGSDNRIEASVEEREATPSQRQNKEVNAGFYCFKIPHIFPYLAKIERSPHHKEYYLPDVFSILRKEGEEVNSFPASSPQEVLGINNRYQLAMVERLMREEFLKNLMMKGVTIVDPHSTYIDSTVKVGKDTVIHPQVVLQGNTRIGPRCQIHSFSKISHSWLGQEVIILSNSVIESSRIRKGARIGPFARLRPESLIGPEAKIGNFVEVKKSVVGRGSKANHLTYLGDAIIGKKVNIGAGTITCNYDGKKKWQTIIEDGVFIGSNTEIIAPLTIRKGAYIGAGSTITKEVPPHSLAIARDRQVNIKKWVLRNRKGKK